MAEKKRHKRRCGEIARGRARHARAMKLHPLLVGLVFFTTLLSIPSPVGFPSIPRSRSGAEGDWPVSDYERGFSTAPKRIRNRNPSEPTIRQLVKDLRRPAARADAEQHLLARIPDAGLRDWLAEQIRNDQVSRLAIFMRPGSSDECVMASWRAALDAEKLELEADADAAVAREKALKLLSGISIQFD